MHESAPHPNRPGDPAPNTQLLAADAEQLPPHDEPRVWIGSWLDYNAGVLHGQWISANQTDEEIGSAIQAILNGSPTTARYGDPAEDWGVFDFDNFGPLRIGEQETITWIGAVGRGIAEHGPAFAAYADVVEDREALRGFEDDYLGTWPSFTAYVESFSEDAGYNQLLDEALPDSIRAYVELNTAALARDMQADGCIHTVGLPDGSVALFAAVG